MPINLDDLFERYANVPPMRRAARNYLRAATRTKVNSKPLTGSYYWTPELDDRGRLAWMVCEFFDRWLPTSDHVSVWRHVRDDLESRFHKDLREIGYCSL